jgi:hypothetical protein
MDIDLTSSRAFIGFLLPWILAGILSCRMSLLEEGGWQVRAARCNQRRRMILFNARQKVRAMLR